MENVENKPHWERDNFMGKDDDAIHLKLQVQLLNAVTAFQIAMKHLDELGVKV